MESFLSKCTILLCIKFREFCNLDILASSSELLNMNSLYRTEVNIRSVNATVVVWLQNDAGYQRWGPTEDRVEQLLESFRPGRERERDKAQLLSPTHSTSSPAANTVTSQPPTISSQPLPSANVATNNPTASESANSGHTNNV